MTLVSHGRANVGAARGPPPVVHRPTTEVHEGLLTRRLTSAPRTRTEKSTSRVAVRPGDGPVSMTTRVLRTERREGDVPWGWSDARGCDPVARHTRGKEAPQLHLITCPCGASFSSSWPGPPASWQCSGCRTSSPLPSGAPRSPRTPCTQGTPLLCTTPRKSTPHTQPGWKEASLYVTRMWHHYHRQGTLKCQLPNGLYQ